MWGRECRHQDLLSTVNNLQCNTEEDFSLEDTIMTGVISPFGDIVEMADIFSPPLDNPQEEFTIIDESRITIIDESRILLLLMNLVFTNG